MIQWCCEHKCSSHRILTRPWACVSPTYAYLHGCAYPMMCEDFLFLVCSAFPRIFWFFSKCVHMEFRPVATVLLLHFILRNMIPAHAHSFALHLCKKNLFGYVNINLSRALMHIFVHVKYYAQKIPLHVFYAKVCDPPPLMCIFLLMRKHQNIFFVGAHPSKRL